MQKGSCSYCLRADINLIALQTETHDYDSDREENDLCTHSYCANCIV